VRKKKKTRGKENTPTEEGKTRGPFPFIVETQKSSERKKGKILKGAVSTR